MATSGGDKSSTTVGLCSRNSPLGHVSREGEEAKTGGAKGHPKWWKSISRPALDGIDALASRAGFTRFVP